MKRKLIVFLSLFFVVKVVYTQQQFVKVADKLFENYAFSEASGMYLTLLHEDYDYDYNYKLAECYRNMNMSIEAEHWYGILANQAITDPKILFNYAQLLKTNGKYKSAKEWFLQYAKFDANGYYLAGTCDFAMNNLRKTSQYTIDTVPFNTKGSDISPAFYKEGILLASTGDPDPETETAYLWTGLPFYDLYFSRPAGNSFTKQILIDEDVNSQFHDATPHFDDVNQVLYITRNSSYKGRAKKGKQDEVKLDLYMSSYNEGDFSKVEKFSYNSRTYSTGHACTSPDGNILLFASDMPGGLGGTDIYYCVHTTEGWSFPANMGVMINTPGDEMFPFIADDGKFYFASDWHPGFGGLDIFVSERNNNSWTKPENAGIPINSSFDDFSFIIRNGQGFFSSNRITGKGSDDIYSFVLLNSVSKIQVRNSKREPVSNAKVILYEDDHAINAGFTNEQGMVEINLKEGSKYGLNISKEGYLQTNVTAIESYRTSNGILMVDFQELYGTNEKLATDKNPDDLPASGDTTIISNDGTTIPSADVISYDVQIGIFKNPDYGKISSLAELGELSVKSWHDGTLLFSIINLETEAGAENAKSEIIKKGFQDAFIIKYKNGIRVE